MRMLPLCPSQGNLSKRRRELVLLAFAKLDRSGTGTVTLDDVRAEFDASKHPDVIDGKKTADQVLLEFMSQWEGGKLDGKVTQDEFLDYYKGACVVCVCARARARVCLSVCMRMCLCVCARV